MVTVKNVHRLIENIRGLCVDIRSFALQMTDYAWIQDVTLKVRLDVRNILYNLVFPLSGQGTQDAPIPVMSSCQKYEFKLLRNKFK